MRSQAQSHYQNWKILSNLSPNTNIIFPTSQHILRMHLVGFRSFKLKLDRCCRAEWRALVLEDVHCWKAAPERLRALPALQVACDDLDGQCLRCAWLADYKNWDLVEDTNDGHKQVLRQGLIEGDACKYHKVSRERSKVYLTCFCRICSDLISSQAVFPGLDAHRYKLTWLNLQIADKFLLGLRDDGSRETLPTELVETDSLGQPPW